MASNSSISVVAPAASAGRPPSWAPAALSTTAPPCQKRQIGESLRLNRGTSGEFRFIVRYRTAGRSAPRRFITIGRFGALTTEEARKRAKTILGAEAI